MKQVKNLSLLIPLLLCIVPLIASQSGDGDEAPLGLTETSDQELNYQNSQKDRQDIQQQLNNDNLQQEISNNQQQKVPSQGFQNPILNRRPGLFRNIVTPFRRFLFPGIKEDPNKEFRLPSPVWLAAATANQIIPVLRAVDDQFSPWLQTLATLSRPKYLSPNPTDGQQYKSQSSQQQNYQNNQNFLPNQQQNNGLYGNGNRLPLFPFLGR